MDASRVAQCIMWGILILIGLAAGGVFGAIWVITLMIGFYIGYEFRNRGQTL